MERTLKTVFVADRPVAPSKIVCIGRNYVEHIQELRNEVPDEMVVFFKPNSAIANELKSFHQEQLHFEGELCFLVEKGRFSAVGFGLDLTKRALQNTLKAKGLPWERAKAFDGSAIFSQFIELSRLTADLTFELDINGRRAQTGTVDLMIYKMEDILYELFTFLSLSDGDIVMTGTTKGVGVVNRGDVFVGKIKDKEEVIVRAEWIAK